MKTLKDHVILYDAVCPMCNLYTKGFVKTGMLDENGRIPYQTMPDNLACLVDKKRSVNEIALVHTSSGEVYYGVESLMRIIGHSLPFLRPLFRCNLFIKIADMLYKFISFNRRVIMPSKKDEVSDDNLDPSFHRGYRIAYLFFTWLLTAFVLHKYSHRLADILPAKSFIRELLVCGGQMVWQGLAIKLLAKEKSWDYLGSLMTISFAGAGSLCIIMLAGKLFQLQNPIWYGSLFFLVVGLMLLEHIRRTKLLGLSWKMSVSWVLYRFFVLFITLSPNYVK
jgi:predicted DCC family thiol-disulfide oxidoreductase YuxK